jgi:diaminohydroxyphosphoribosylaminopyrimidine deaminase / 5-amino-6-(5-phosphoribosylamino)uracil reductase
MNAPQVALPDGRLADPMLRALELAYQAGRVSPNPAVGAVVVRDGRVVGEGYTQPPGGAHAEVEALREAGAAGHGAQLYVTLEPCSFYGRTPPCTDAVLAAGIASVSCAMEDPDPHVRGAGVARLRAAGVTVELGSHEAEARDFLADYVKQRLTGLPLVIAKFAASLDGKIATRTGDSRWVSGPQSRAWAHNQRARLDAILVGVNTVLVDNPLLTARPGGEEGSAHQPLRVVVDSRGRTPSSANVLTGPARTLVATTGHSSPDWRTEMECRGAEVALLPEADGLVSLPALLELLGRRACLNALVEGGGILLGSFFDAGLVDNVQAILAPMIIGGARAPIPVAGLGAERMAGVTRLERVVVRRLGDDMLVEGIVPQPWRGT